MNYGFVLPRGDARVASDFAYEAEQAGWDGFFVWEPVWGNDAWISLAAAAMRTQRICLGTMLTPPSRMRPWKLASETVSLDHLSNGRVILAVGLGAVDTGFEEFGEVTGRKERAGLLDESLEILTRLWKAEPFDFDGEHYHVHLKKIGGPLGAPPPVQQPRIPIWVVGAWPSAKSMQRVARYDGLLPNMLGKDGKVQFAQPAPQDIREMAVYIKANRTLATPFDIVVEGQTPGDDPDKAAAQVRPFAEAGATWWNESMWDAPDDGRVLARIRQGPPRMR
jgi:alkanesulfonate monooxygenase SsuD/methylene tetrahydromethanopterin reductase-like flavin-dependent oxidoreductase (luciferase family)